VLKRTHSTTFSVESNLTYYFSTIVIGKKKVKKNSHTLNPKPQELTFVTILQNGFDEGVQEVAHKLVACK
jgi:hypothetical protein